MDGFKKHLMVNEYIYKLGDNTIRHQFDDYANHRIVREFEYGTEYSDWESYRGIARIGLLAATTDYYAGNLPRVFRIEEGERKDGVVEE